MYLNSANLTYEGTRTFNFFHNHDSWKYLAIDLSFPPPPPAHPEPLVSSLERLHWQDFQDLPVSFERIKEMIRSIDSPSALPNEEEHVTGVLHQATLEQVTLGVND